jgi:DNA-binding CsgD family transcriptional regulator
LYERAATLLTQMGARREAPRVRSRANGRSRRERLGDGDGSMVGWRSLTKTERGIARFAAVGLTNQQIGQRMHLSRHTVDFHLRRVYRKLNVCSRVQLTRLVPDPNASEPA